SIVWVMFEWCRNTTIYNASSGQWETLPRQRTTIYCAPDDGTVITEVSMFTPESDGEIGLWDRVLWIVVGMQNATATFMHTFALQELGSIAYAESSMLNPLNLPPEFGTPAFPCDFDTEVYFAGYGCTRRFAIDHVFNDGDPSIPITQILIRIVEATNRNQTGLLPDWATGATSGDTTIPFVQATHGVAFVARGRRVSVITIFRGDIDEHGNGSPVAASLANEIDFLGDVTYLHASENAQHLFTAVAREEWEIESQERYLDVCNALAAAPTDPFLQPFAPSCAALPPQPVNLNTFAQYTSYCSFNIYCPSLDDVVFGLPRDSYYADRPAVLKLCPRGSFCAFGMLTQCPPGFYCDEEGLSQPKRCPTAPGFDTTCASYGLTAPEPCAEGAVCIVPHIPGLPAPFGRMVPAPPA
ncbi:MAG: hypothetical protein Q8J97_05330, partial [Flavobacteriaceae bacterium]|nr:hypothetical protein [Flavobacteriaceae bacterium]